MIKALLISRYEPETDLNPWSSRFLTFKKSTSVDLSLVDHGGNSVVHHVIAPTPNFTYSNSDTIVRLLASAGAPLDVVNSAGKTPLQLAMDRKAEKLIQTLKDLLPEDKHPKSSDVSSGTSMKETSINGTSMKEAAGKVVTEREVPNFESDASAVLESLKIEETCEPLKVTADKLLGFGDSSEVLMDESQGIPFSVLLVKPDKESWGVSNFLKLQIVIHKQRNLVVLFSHSGQLGQQLNPSTWTHSKETFSKKSEAIDEFVKLFKSKTGNSWSPIDKFVPVTKKYRLVPMRIKSFDIKSKLEKLRREKIIGSVNEGKSSLTNEEKPLLTNEEKPLLTNEEKPSLTNEEKPININEAKSSLSNEVSELMSQVMKDLMTPQSNEDIDCVTCVKLITDDVVKRAEDILFEIGVVIGEREKELKVVTGEREKELKQAKRNVPINSSKILDQLTDLSDEFFNLIPIPIKSRLSPILNESDHRSKNDILRRIRNYIISGKIILASYLKIPTINQLDYIYDCLKCEISVLDQSSIESQILLQFIHNSSLNQKNKPMVESIFKTNKKSQEDQLVKINLPNHWLLFHSVPSKELLNILSSGFQITSSDSFMKVANSFFIILTVN